MISSRRAILVLALTASGVLCVGGAPLISTFSAGVLTWTNSDTQGVVSVEWASSATGTWSGTWGVIRQPVTGALMSTTVPMFFRLSQNPNHIHMEWLPVANVHNAADSNGYGIVNYSYRISKYEISNHQYAQFLNAVDSSGGNGLALYSSSMGTDLRGGITNNVGAAAGQHYTVKANMGDKPVVFVNFWDALRFANWLHNGQGNGGTETGAYHMASTTPVNSSASRTPGARVFLPNEDEWYKAAYYDAAKTGYWVYPSRSNGVPVVASCGTTGSITNDQSNIANYNSGARWNGQTGNVTSIGSGGVGSESSYGVADMAGNVYEWTETAMATNYRCARGGCWFSLGDFLKSSHRNGFEPSNHYDSVGFRVAAQP